MLSAKFTLNFFWIAMFLPSCSKSEEKNPVFVENYIVNFTPNDQTTVNASFPDNVNNIWTYETVSYFDFLDTERTDTVIKYKSDVQIVFWPTFYGLSDVIELKVHPTILYSIVTATDPGDGSTFYQNKSDGLYEVAYFNPYIPFVNPKAVSGAASQQLHRPLFPFDQTHKVSSDTVFRDKLVLNYPLSNGKKWIVFDSPWTQRAEIAAKGLVQVPAGILPAYRMKHFNEINAYDYTFNSYFGNAGLVAREVINYDLEFTDEQNPEGAGLFFDWIEKTELVSYTIAP